MAHVKAVSSGAQQGINVAGKRRGVKVQDGQKVKPGDIIVRQVGTKIHAGHGVKLGKDFTIFAVTKGVVKFKRMTGYKRNRRIVSVVSEEMYKKMTKKD